MQIAYWIVAGLLALLYIAAGSIKIFRPPAKLAVSGFAWAADFPAWTVKVIGLLEVVGAIGLILPVLADVAPGLAPLAAIGLALIQLGAIATHLVRGEAKMLPANLLLVVWAAAAAWIGYLVWM